MNEGVLLEQDMGEHDLLLENQKKVEQGQQTNFAIAYKKSQQKKTIKTEIKKVPLSFSFSFSFSFSPFFSLPFPIPFPFPSFPFLLTLFLSFPFLETANT